LAKEKELDVEAAIKKSGLGVLSDSELNSIVERIIAQNQSVIEERGAGAQSMLMGKIMAEVRGRVDGKLVSKTLGEKMTQSTKRKG
jgi:glutamyl-tRNA(Gln) amidotransferase subunit E